MANGGNGAHAALGIGGEGWCVIECAQSKPLFGGSLTPSSSSDRKTIWSTIARCGQV